MRNLTIKREKTAVASLASIKLYIEDPYSDELVINDVHCRKLGEIKNGEEKTFQIEDGAARLFAIADKLSKDYSNDCYKIPAGENDIYLTGKNKLDPAAGNAFVFEGNDNEEAVENRKQGKKKGRIVLIIAFIIGFVAGTFGIKALFNANASKEKAFKTNGLSINLTNGFREIDASEYGYTVGFDSKEVAIFALKEPFSLVEGFSNLDTNDYMDLVVTANSSRNAQKTIINGDPCIVYDFENTETNETYRYISYPYKAKDAFWLVQFATTVETSEKYSNDISKWARSVSFYE